MACLKVVPVLTKATGEEVRMGRPQISQTGHLIYSSLKVEGKQSNPWEWGVDDCLSCSKELKKSDLALSPR